MQRSSPANLTGRLAQNEDEIIQAQELRYRVFYDGMGAVASSHVAKTRRDVDPFDRVCDHLLVIENEQDIKKAKVVGTYRLLRKAVASKNAGYYSANEFDLGALRNYGGEHVELGRSCVDPEYRGKAIMQLLWRGIAD